MHGNHQRPRFVCAKRKSNHVFNLGAFSNSHEPGPTDKRRHRRCFGRFRRKAEQSEHGDETDLRFSTGSQPRAPEFDVTAWRNAWPRAKPPAPRAFWRSEPHCAVNNTAMAPHFLDSVALRGSDIDGEGTMVNIAERLSFALCAVAFASGGVVACGGSVTSPRPDNNAGGNPSTGGTTSLRPGTGGLPSSGGAASSQTSTNTSTGVTGTHTYTSTGTLCSCLTAPRATVCTGTGPDTSTLSVSNCSTTPTGTGYGYTFSCQWNGCGAPCASLSGCTSGVAVSTATGASTHTATGSGTSAGTMTNVPSTATGSGVSTGTSTGTGSTP